MELLAILWAVQTAHSNFRKRNIRTKTDLTAYQELLSAARYLLLVGIVESDQSSDMARWISAKLIKILDVQIEELDDLIQLDPLVLGSLKK